MSCPDCEKTSRLRQRLFERLQAAATAHGYELWTREGAVRLEVLAVPVAASYGTPDALVDTFAELGSVGMPRAPRRRAQIDRRGVQLTRRQEAGHKSYQIDGTPPIELVFIGRLLG